MEDSGQLETLLTFLPGKEQTVIGMVAGPQGRSGRFGEDKRVFSLT